MTVVLVHGNPETAAIWSPLLPHLDPAREVVLLSPPGFGAPLPAGFGATVPEYRDWLVGELEPVVARSGPVDLVGHDWGGGHAVNVAMARPDLLRTWATDILGVFDPDYVWHDLAQGWQTPGVGEASVEHRLTAPVERHAAALRSLGVSATVADSVAAGYDGDMGRGVLALYRSAAQPAMAELGAGLEAAAARPGLAVSPTEDTYVGTMEQRRRSAVRAGARVVELDGLGHWWFNEDPARAATVLQGFWDEI